MGGDVTWQSIERLGVESIAPGAAVVSTCVAAEEPCPTGTASIDHDFPALSGARCGATCCGASGRA